MSNADVIVYVHPELPQASRDKLSREVAAISGVASAKFDQHKHPHALLVAYNPQAMSGEKILDFVKKQDPSASLVGL